MSKSSQKKWVVGGLVSLVVLLLVLWGAWQAFLAPSKMHAVKLSNGSIYFGELTRFPEFGLKNVYTIQPTGNKKNPFRVQRFQNTFWGPQDSMDINRDQVIWQTELSSDSQLSKLIEQNPNLRPTQRPQGARPQAPQAPNQRPAQQQPPANNTGNQQQPPQDSGAGSSQ